MHTHTLVWKLVLEKLERVQHSDTALAAPGNRNASEWQLWSREGAGPEDPYPGPTWSLGLSLSGGHSSGPKRILQLPDVALHGFQALGDGRRRLESRHTWYGNLGTDGGKKALSHG